MSFPFWSLLAGLGMLAIEASYVPQIARLARLKRADEVSLYFPLLNLLGRLGSLAYTLHAGELVLGAGFLLGVALRGTLLAQVLYYQRHPGGRRAATLNATPAPRPAPARLRPREVTP